MIYLETWNNVHLPVPKLAFVVLSIAHAMDRAVKGRKQERNLRNTEPMRNFFSQDPVSTVGIFALLLLNGLFTGSKIIDLYGIISVAALLIGFLAMAYSISMKAAQEKECENAHS